MASKATIFTTDSGGSHSVTNASTAYFPKLRQIIAICEGFRTRVLAHEKRNAGGAPNASIKYAYSAPDDVFMVPNSAYANAPANIQKIHFLTIFHLKCMAMSGYKSLP